MFRNMMKKMKFLALSTALFFGAMSISTAQTDKDIIDTYNQGVQLLNSDTQGAITFFEKCISLADKAGSDLGEKATESKKLAADQIPKLYFKLAVDSYKKRNFEGAIKNFGKSAETGKKYGNTALAQKSQRLIPKIYYAWGKQEFIKKNYDKSLEIFEKGIQVNPNVASAFLGKALVYDKLKQEDKMKTAANKAIEIAKKTHDQKTLGSAKTFMRNFTYNHAVISIQKNDKNTAEQYLKSSITYGNNSPDVYFELGKIYQQQGKYDQALADVRKALSLDKGNDIVKARYYYILGKIYENTNKKAEACNAFKKALHPPYEESAKFEIVHVLKCGK